MKRSIFNLRRGRASLHGRPKAPRDPVRPLSRRRTLLLAAAVAALALSGSASAVTITSRDAQGRPITFDVQAEGVDVEWYASLLRTAAHGPEISTVTIRIVSPDAVARICGRSSLACYSRSRAGALIVVPAGSSDASVAHALLHEYGHHLDSVWSVSGVPELNGTPGWWARRGMAALYRAGAVAFSYVSAGTAASRRSSPRITRTSTSPGSTGSGG